MAFLESEWQKSDFIIPYMAGLSYAKTKLVLKMALQIIMLNIIKSRYGGEKLICCFHVKK